MSGISSPLDYILNHTVKYSSEKIACLESGKPGNNGLKNRLELIHHPVPARLMDGSHMVVGETGVAEDDFGRAAMLDEAQRHQRILVVGVSPTPGEGQSFRTRDFEV